VLDNREAAPIGVPPDLVRGDPPFLSLLLTVLVHDDPAADHALLIGFGGWLLPGLRRHAPDFALEDNHFAPLGPFGNPPRPILVPAAQAQPQLVPIEDIDPLYDFEGSRAVDERSGDVDLLGVFAGVQSVGVVMGIGAPVLRVHENPVFVNDPHLPLA